MYINEYGNPNDPKLILLAPMMVSGSDLYNLMSPYLKAAYFIIAPDQGGHGRAGAYISADEEYRQLKEYLQKNDYTDVKPVIRKGYPHCGYMAAHTKEYVEEMERFIAKEKGRLKQVIKLKGLNKEEVEAISKQIADAFYDYKYNEADLGLVKYIRSREDMFTYMNAITQAAYNSGLLFTTSDRCEGYLMLSGEGAGAVRFFDGIKMIIAEKRALGGLSNMKEFIKACFAEGNTIETRMKKAKRKFIRIEMLVVRPEFQRQGHMRKMLEDVYKIADKKGISVILDTDDKDKAARYEHLGMKLDRVRNCGEKFHMYDLIRE